MFDNHKRTALFRKLFLLGDLPEELQEYWSGLLGNVSVIEQKFAAAIVRDGNNYGGILEEPAVNRYWKSVNSARENGQFGTIYQRKDGERSR